VPVTIGIVEYILLACIHTYMSHMCIQVDSTRRRQASITAQLEKLWDSAVLCAPVLSIAITFAKI
jgi:acetolactate synthase regulatory subunit